MNPFPPSERKGPWYTPGGDHASAVRHALLAARVRVDRDLRATALALHLARNYGVRVRAYNISREQLAHARERARSEGLDGQVEFIEIFLVGVAPRRHHDHVLDDRNLERETGLLDDPLRLAELQDDRLLGLLNGE